VKLHPVKFQSTSEKEPGNFQEEKQIPGKGTEMKDCPVSIARPYSPWSISVQSLWDGD
jgi:hypothetical protein